MKQRPRQGRARSTLHHHRPLLLLPRLLLILASTMLTVTSSTTRLALSRSLLRKPSSISHSYHSRLRLLAAAPCSCLSSSGTRRSSCSLPDRSYPCPLWSSSFSFCLQPLAPHKSRSTSISTASSASASFASVAAPMEDHSIDQNALLQDFDFPPFDAVEPQHVRPGIRALLKKLENDLEELEKTVEPSWPKVVEPLEKIVDRLTVVWGMVNHLKAVKDSAELRSAIEDVQQEKVKFQLRLGQSKPIYNAFKAIQDSPDWQTLSDARKRIVENQIKEAVLNGVSLEDDKRDQFNKVEQELEKLSKKFDENVLDATKKYEKLITDKKEIEGLPATALGLAAQTAVSKGHESATPENGPWIITLDAPSFMSVMQHARNRALREEVYRAYISRASTGDINNTPIIDQILKLRLEKAQLLGYKNYAEVQKFASDLFDHSDKHYDSL